MLSLGANFWAQRQSASFWASPCSSSPHEPCDQSFSSIAAVSLVSNWMNWVVWGETLHPGAPSVHTEDGISAPARLSHRCARKSSWTEEEGRVRSAGEDGGWARTPFSALATLRLFCSDTAFLCGLPGTPSRFRFLPELAESSLAPGSSPARRPASPRAAAASVLASQPGAQPQRCLLFLLLQLPAQPSFPQPMAALPIAQRQRQGGL